MHKNSYTVDASSQKVDSQEIICMKVLPMLMFLVEIDELAVP